MTRAELPENLHGRVIDMHAHFFPEKLFASIWDWFETRGWRINYRGDEARLVGTIHGFGVERFAVLNYAHRAGVAERLNSWTARFAADWPQALPFATVHPDDEGNARMLESLFDEHRFLGVKIQPLVSDFYPCDRRMFDVYRLLVERGKILVAHAGTAPVANSYVGAEHFEPVMREFPGMKVIVCHMGAFETGRFIRMAREYPNLYMDTAMSFIDERLMRALIARGEFPPLSTAARYGARELLELSDRVLFGSDFPNIPYDYAASISGVLSLGLGEEFERKVFRENALHLVGSVP